METSTQQGFNGSYVGINKIAHSIHSLVMRAKAYGYRNDNGHRHPLCMNETPKTIVILFMSRGFSVLLVRPRSSRKGHWEMCVCVLVASLFSWFLFSLVQWFLCVSAPWLVCLCLCGSRVVSIQFILYIPIEKIVHAYNLTEYWASNANKSANAFEMLLPHSHSFVFFFSPTFSPIPSPTRILIDENRDKIWWARLGPSACKRHTKLQNFCKHIQVKWPIVV